MMSKFNDVWVWGNPLLANEPSYAADLYPHPSYIQLAMITAKNYEYRRQQWEDQLKFLGVTPDTLREMIAHYKVALDKPKHDPLDYVATKMGMTKRQVQKLLYFVNLKEALEFAYMFENMAKKVTVSSRSTSVSIKAPTPEQLGKQIAKTSHICAAGFDGCYGEIKGRFSLCLNCYKELGSHDPEKWSARTRSWLPAMIKEIRKQWVKDARNNWYREHYPHLSEDEFERIANAA